MHTAQEQSFAQKALAGLKAEHDRVVGERDAAIARAEKAESRLRQADTLLFMTETMLGPRTTPGPERLCAARALMNAMRAAGYNVDPI